MQLQKIFTSQKLHKILYSLTTKRNFYVAFSGGLDSYVLLHSLLALKEEHPEINLTAIHVNHNLSANADVWQRHCAKVCADLQVEYIDKKVDVKENLSTGKSLEAVARKLRYQVFADLVPETAVLLTAHQADDQAETLLLQLFRGAGPKGLASMPQKLKFADTELIRPLLKFPRAALLEYAKHNKLQWIEDESNFDVNLERNFIRHQVLPVIYKHWPGITAILNRVATHCAETDFLLQTLAKQDYQFAKGSVENTLSVKKILSLELSRQSNLLRFWLQQLNFLLPSTKKIREIQKSLLTCRADATPLVQWQGVEVRRYQDNIYAMRPLPKHDNNLVLSWDPQKPLQLPSGIGILHCQIKDVSHLDFNHITVRFRRGGEQCVPKGNKHHRALKKLFQEWRIPPWQRNCVPLIYYKNELMIVVGFCVCKNWDENVVIYKLKS